MGKFVSDEQRKAVMCKLNKRDGSPVKTIRTHKTANSESKKLSRERLKVKKSEKKTNNEYKLKTVYDSRKSFNKKATVIEKNGTKELWSYSTKVAVISDGKAKVLGTHSPTTLRHIKEFLKQDGFKAESKKQIEKDYMNNKGKGRKSKEVEWVKQPKIITNRDDTDSIRKIPKIERAKIKGWKKVNTYFVDSSGFGHSGEPALTFEEFRTIIKEGRAYAIVEEGQFQVRIGEFVKT